MKNLNKTIMTLVLLMTAATGAWADSSGSCGNGLTWELKGTELTITKTGEGSGELNSNPCGNDFTILNIGKDVTSIVGKAFLNCKSMTTINFEEGSKLTTIGNDAFAGSGLTSITIPEGVTSIGTYAFNNSDLISVTIPGSLETIPSFAFYYCEKLTTVTINEGVTIISDEVFTGCKSLTTITIPKSLTKISSSAFNQCSSLESIHISDLEAWCKIFYYNITYKRAYHLYLNDTEIKDLVIPDGVTSIGNHAFSFCSLNSITIPSTVTSIASTAFEMCSALTAITVDEENTVYDSRNDCNAIIETASNTLVLGCKNTVIPSTVTAIGDRAFYGCTDLTTITIPTENVTLGSEVFEYYYYVQYGDGGGSFSGYLPNLKAIYVPAGAMAAYRAMENWKEFAGLIKRIPVYDLTVGENAHGGVVFKVDDEIVTTATKGQTVTVVVTPETGYAIDSLSGKWSAGWGEAMSRRLGYAAPTVDISDDVELTRMNDTTYTFVMKATNMYVDVTYKHRHIWDFSAEGDSIFATCQNQSGDCKILKVKAGIAIDGLLFGSAKGAKLDLKLFKDSLEGEAAAEVTSISYSGTIRQTGKSYGPSASAPTLPGEYTVTIKVKVTDADEKETELNLTKDYFLGQKPIDEDMVQPIDDVTYNGKAHEPDVKLIFQGKTMVQNVDYTVEYRENVNAGVALVIFTGIGNFTGTTTTGFNILDVKLTADMVADIADQNYTGKAIEPEVKVTFGKEELQKGRDYIVTYENNVEPGVATVIIDAWMSGNFKGKVTKTFNIVAPTGIDSIQAAAAAGKAYNMQGRRVKNVRKGVIIVNGKKVIK